MTAGRRRHMSRCPGSPGQPEPGIGAYFWAAASGFRTHESTETLEVRK